MIEPCGVDGKQTTFMFLDTQVLYEGFLEDINNLLNSGEIPGLLEQQDRERIINNLRETHIKMGRPGEPD